MAHAGATFTTHRTVCYQRDLTVATISSGHLRKIAAMMERRQGNGPNPGSLPLIRMAKALLTPQALDFPRWYQDVIAKAELAENGPAAARW